MNLAGLRLRAVLVNYNGGPLLQRAVHSILDARWSGPLDVVVIDNDSEDGSIDDIVGLPGVHVILRDTNEGFGANNHGLSDLLGIGPVLDLAEPDVVLLLNPDAMVRADSLERLAEALEPDIRVGAASPRIIFDRPFVELTVAQGDVTITQVWVDDLDVTAQCHGVDGAFRLPGSAAPIWRCAAGTGLRIPAQEDGQRIVLQTGPTSNGMIGPANIVGDGETVLDARHRRTVTVIQNAGSQLGERGVGQNRGFTLVDGEAEFEPFAPAWCGAAVLLSADYVRDVGGFEPTYFLYYEDIDLSLRGLARGWSTAYVADAIVEHRHSDRATQGTRQVEVLQHRNRLVMLVRNAPIGRAVSAFVAATVTPASLFASSFSAGDAAARRRLARWRLQAVVDATRMLPAAIRGRRSVARDRRVPAREVMESAGGSTLAS